MNINIDRKRKYVRIVSEILRTEGMQGVSIRRVAKEAGCTSAVLYKHFDNLEHLIMVASVEFLAPYTMELSKLTKRTDITSIQMDLYLWKFFIREAFSNKIYYKMMFFGDNTDMLEKCIYEYYSLFPENEKEMDGFGASIILSSDLNEREFIRLRRAANAGLITMENAFTLSRLTTAVFRGMFSQYPDMQNDRGMLQMAVDDCYQLIYELFKRFVAPGTSLDISDITG